MKKKEKLRTAEQEEMRKLGITVLIVIILVAGIALFTSAFVTKDLFNKKDEEKEVVDGTVNYEVAIVGNILNRPYDSYYVLVFDKQGDSAADMNDILNGYKSLDPTKNTKLHVYVVDLSNKMNSSFYDAEKENTSAKSVAEFKFGNKTLLKIKDGKVEKYIVDLEKMKKELGL